MDASWLVVLARSCGLGANWVEHERFPLMQPPCQSAAEFESRGTERHLIDDATKSYVFIAVGVWPVAFGELAL